MNDSYEEDIARLAMLIEMSIGEVKNALLEITKTSEKFTSRLEALAVAMQSNNWRKMHGYPKRRTNNAR